MRLFSAPLGELIFIGAGYALGCFSTGYYLVRWRTGQDIRAIGSGSTGSTNVGRMLGAPGFMITMIGDIAKGSVALWAALHFGVAPWGIMLVMIAVMLGHIWPAQLGFRGGKGLASILGIGIVLDYRLTLMMVGVAVLGSLCGLGKAVFLAAAVISPAVAALLGRQATEVAGLSAIVLLILIAHRANVRAFFSGRRGKKGPQA
jgi:acyl phosphate:glycerol-3-phosphate acyltransferase